MGEILDFTLLSTNICSNRILYCPLKSRLKSIQRSKIMIESFRPRNIYHTNIQKSISSLKASMSFRQFQNIGTKQWIQKELKALSSSFIGNTKSNIVTTFWEADLSSVFNKKGTKVFSMEEIKSTRRSKHNVSYRHFINPLHSHVQHLSGVAFLGDTVLPFRTNPKHMLV